ncbi:HTH-like domain-containing protein [Nitrosomonas sp. Nm51]|nr:HTH-like domain-containing protein [Nitrosomonas sp. Nm51]
MLGRWVKRSLAEDDGQAFRGNGKLTPEQQEIRSLKSQVKQLKLERQIYKGGGSLLRERNELKYSFITQKKKTYPVVLMCRLLGVSRSAYYEYAKRQRNQPDDLYHRELLDATQNIAQSCNYACGSRRMKQALNARGYPVGRWKTRRLMREAGIKVRYRKKYKVTANSNNKQPVFDNILNRQFNVDRPDQVYVCDIMYIWTQEGWLYLAIAVDLFSRKVVGWSMRSRMKAQLVCDALRMAIWQRRPPPGLIVHSDRGSQYASKAYRKLLKAYGL